MSESDVRVQSVRRALRLEYFTITYNIVEAIAAVGLGMWIGSVSLQGFGFDSMIETVSAAVLVWRLRIERGGGDTEAVEKVERKAERIVGTTFFALTAYILWEAIRNLLQSHEPDTSVPNLVIASASIVFMIPLALQKKKLAVEMKSRALAADATETWVCVILSGILLVGAALHALVGWWWVDSAVSLCMTPFLIHEGWEAIRGENDDSTEKGSTV